MTEASLAPWAIGLSFVAAAGGAAVAALKYRRDRKLIELAGTLIALVALVAFCVRYAIEVMRKPNDVWTITEDQRMSIRRELAMTDARDVVLVNVVASTVHGPNPAKLGAAIVDAIAGVPKWGAILSTEDKCPEMPGVRVFLTADAASS